MGLDMGLVKRPKKNDELMYWRKANQIREWFANNLAYFHDNGETKVYKEDLESLLATIDEVLEHREKAKDLLPRSQGFFFGSYEYDDWYWQDLTETKAKLEEILRETDWDNEDVFYWEWY